MPPDPTAIPYGYCQCGCGERTRLAPCDRPARGWTKGEPQRYLPNHHGRKYGDKPKYIEEDRGYATPCWVWQWARDAHGYGRGFKGCKQLAYRVMWESVNGPVPEGLELDHLCRVPACVNPDHLEPVTHAENVRRGMSGDHQRSKTHCKHGHEYTPENTGRTRKGFRYCKVCNTRTSVESNRRRRAAARAARLAA